QGGTTPGQSDTGMATGQTGTAGNQNSLRGCLGGSPSNGTYYLTDSKSGTTYTLVGGSDQLRTHVGQQVEVTGQALGSGGTSPTSTSSSSSSMGDSSASASSSTSGSTSAQTGDAGSMSTGPGTGNAQTTATNSFQVSNVTKIAEHCGSNNTGNPGPTASIAGRYEMAALMAPQTGAGGGWTGSGSAGAGASRGMPPPPQGGRGSPPRGAPSPPRATAPPRGGTATPQGGTATPQPGTATPGATA